MHQSKVDFSAIQVYPADLNPHPGANRVAKAGAFAAQLLTGLIKTEVFTAQFGDVYQPFNVHGVQRYKNAKPSRCCDHAAKLFT